MLYIQRAITECQIVLSYCIKIDIKKIWGIYAVARKKINHVRHDHLLEPAPAQSISKSNQKMLYYKDKNNYFMILDQPCNIYKDMELRTPLIILQDFICIRKLPMMKSANISKELQSMRMGSNFNALSKKQIKSRLPQPHKRKIQQFNISSLGTLPTLSSSTASTSMKISNIFSYCSI